MVNTKTALRRLATWMVHVACWCLNGPQSEKRVACRCDRSADRPRPSSSREQRTVVNESFLLEEVVSDDLLSGIDQKEKDWKPTINLFDEVMEGIQGPLKIMEDYWQEFYSKPTPIFLLPTKLSEKEPTTASTDDEGTAEEEQSLEFELPLSLTFPEIDWDDNLVWETNPAWEGDFASISASNAELSVPESVWQYSNEGLAQLYQAV